MAFLKSADRHIQDGLKHMQTWELEKALESFQQAEKKRPEDPNTINYISQVYTAMNNLNKATEYILKAITLEPQSPIHKQLYATILMRQGKNYDAIPIIDEILEIQDVEIMYVLRGQADYNMGNIEEAIEFFDRALSMDPNNPYANHMKGVALYRLKRYIEAIPPLEKALALEETETLKDILADCKAKIETQ